MDQTTKNRLKTAAGLVIALSAYHFVGNQTLSAKAKPVPPQRTFIAPGSHQIPVPEGYVDIMAPGSPAADYYKESLEAFKAAGMKPDNMISSLFRQADLARYYAGGPNPASGHYIYVTYFPSSKARVEMESMRGNIRGLKDQVQKGFDAANASSKVLQVKEARQLGIVKEWADGFIYGTVVKMESHLGGKTRIWSKLLLTGMVPNSGGGYFVSDVSLIQKDGDFESATARLESLSKGIYAANN